MTDETLKDSRPEVAEDREEDGHVSDAAAPAVVFGYLPGFTAGVQAGYREGRRDLEREKSEAAADGFRRGKRAAEAFLPGAQPKAKPAEILFWGMVLGFLIGGAVEARRLERQKIEEEGARDELPDVRD